MVGSENCDFLCAGDIKVLIFYMFGRQNFQFLNESGSENPDFFMCLGVKKITFFFLRLGVKNPIFSVPKSENTKFFYGWE